MPTLYLVGADDGCIAPEVGEGVEKHFTGPFEKGLSRAPATSCTRSAPRRSTGSCSSFSTRRDEQRCQRPPLPLPNGPACHATGGTCLRSVGARR